MKLSEKQKAVIKIMQANDGNVIRWIGGLKPKCFLSNHLSPTVSTATTLRLAELGLIQKHGDEYKFHYILTEKGKTITL